jgi:hypothetical protein
VVTQFAIASIGVVLRLKPSLVLWLTIFGIHGDYLPSTVLEERKVACSVGRVVRECSVSGPVKISSAERAAWAGIDEIGVDMMKVPQGFGRLMTHQPREL